MDVAWREVRDGWKKEAQRHPKLEGIKSLIMEQECEGRSMMVKCKRRRRRLVKLRGGTAELEVETGRWRGVRRVERICKNCRGGGCWTFGDEMYVCGRGKGEVGGANE